MIILVYIALSCVHGCHARLLARTTERAIVAKNDDFKTVSITKHCLHDHEKLHRKSRSYIDYTVDQSNNVKRSVEKGKIPLVKKPIPMYVEINYEDDYQTRQVRWPEKYRDSSENEDEDFNVDDYEFDVNHDEFASRRKPLVPRTKPDKNDGEVKTATKSETKSTPADIKGNERTPKPQTKNKRENKMSDKATDKSNKSKLEDYYDELTSKIPGKLMKVVYSHEDLGDESDASVERERRGSIRTIRSPWDIGIYMDKLGEKTSLIVDKVLSILPMFPQIPTRKSDGIKK
ncbi:hypothetical protein RR46_01432 [Papilio xuthus]|uniref:Uncharacterized protein n=1 Tax=Papilio xuthus TaxID=66420 RepID=A0A0N1ID39_PAPXU|nr:hypothetical protein RR46_01432 [Papilio xuthus]